MFKYNVGDKVIYRGKECKVIIQEYAKECTEGVVINEHKFYTIIDKDNNKYCCNEGELRRMRILDKIINSEDPYDALAELISEDCFNYCIYGNESCTDKDCKEGIKAYFNQEICASKEEPIGVKRREEELKTPYEYLEDAIKEVRKETNNDFMDIYKDIVKNMVDICIKKNKDYGSATQITYENFGDVSYQVRCFDKWQRINTLLKNGKTEVNESIDDTLLDLSNYLILWLTSRKMEHENNVEK